MTGTGRRKILGEPVFLPLGRSGQHIKQMQDVHQDRRRWVKQAENEFLFKCFLSSLKT